MRRDESKDEEANKNEEGAHPDNLEKALNKLSNEEELSDKERDTLLQSLKKVSVTHQSSYSSPLPPPEVLKGYDEILPDGANKIVEIIESQSQHRKDMENRVVNEILRESKWGQLFAFILGILGIISATILGIYGKVVVASIVGGGSLVGLVTAFLWGKSNKASNMI